MDKEYEMNRSNYIEAIRHSLIEKNAKYFYIDPQEEEKQNKTEVQSNIEDEGE